jgi:hypothetical protein
MIVTRAERASQKAALLKFGREKVERETKAREGERVRGAKRKK